MVICLYVSKQVRGNDAIFGETVACIQERTNMWIEKKGEAIKRNRSALYSVRFTPQSSIHLSSRSQTLEVIFLSARRTEYLVGIKARSSTPWRYCDMFRRGLMPRQHAPGKKGRRQKREESDVGEDPRHKTMVKPGQA